MYRSATAVLVLTVSSSAFAVPYDDVISGIIGQNDTVIWSNGERTLGVTVVGNLTVTGGDFTPATVSVDRQNVVGGEAVLTLGPITSGLLNPGAMTVGENARIEVLATTEVGNDLSLSSNGKLNVAGSLTVGASLSMSGSSELKLIGGNGISAENFQLVDGDLSGNGQIISGTTGLIDDSFNPGEPEMVGTLGLGNIEFGPNSSYSVDFEDAGGGNWTPDLIELTGNAGTDADYPAIIGVSDAVDLSTLPSNELYPILTAENALPAIPESVLVFSYFSFDDGREFELVLSDGNRTLNLVLVPEPSLMAIGIVFAASLIRRRRA